MRQFFMAVAATCALATSCFAQTVAIIPDVTASIVVRDDPLVANERVRLRDWQRAQDRTTLRRPATRTARTGCEVTTVHSRNEAGSAIVKSTTRCP